VKFENNYYEINKYLHDFAIKNPLKICEFLFGILQNLQKELKENNNELLTKFVEKTIKYLKDEEISYESEIHNMEWNYALSNYPKYDLINNFISISEASNFLECKLSLSKDGYYLCGDIDVKFGYHFPEVYIPKQDLIDLGLIEEENQFPNYHKVKIISINQ
jgi:hypothetical protein